MGRVEWRHQVQALLSYAADQNNCTSGDAGSLRAEAVPNARRREPLASRSHLPHEGALNTHNQRQTGSDVAFTIAVIDDEPAVVTALSSLLRSVGYETRAYASADAFLADPRPAPDCVISDVNMPGTTGSELVRSLRATNPLVPVILMTAFPSPAPDGETGQESSPYLLRKPFEAETLLSRVSEFVRRA